MHSFRVSIFSCNFRRLSFFTFRCFHAVKFNHKVQPSKLSSPHGRTFGTLCNCSCRFLSFFLFIPVPLIPAAFLRACRLVGGSLILQKKKFC